MSLPDVFAYARYRKYLSDWFDAKKAANRRLSHRWLARELGTRDPSVLVNILSGRRPITDERIEPFVRVLGLEGARADYFRALVAFEDATSEEAALRAWAALADLRTREQPEIGLDAFEFMSAWYIPAIRELARHPRFDPAPAWIARHLDPPITEEQAAKGLAVCLRLGYLREADGRVVISEPTVRTPPQITQLMTWPYHRDGLSLAADGLNRLRAGADRQFIESTVFLGGTLAVPASRIREVRHAVFEMLSRLSTLCDTFEEPPDRVVHLTVSMVPVGHTTDPEG